MSGSEVRAEAPPLLSALVTFVMIIVGALSVGFPVALVIILICLATDGSRLPH
jgi:hypothetical protein